ncbi:MAG: O-antigen ligase family protein [Ignavibacteriales bacterium]|nr:O-antigen ligase family protein [Ignavibacteriales bacterium]
MESIDLVPRLPLIGVPRSALNFLIVQLVLIAFAIVMDVSVYLPLVALVLLVPLSFELGLVLLVVSLFVDYHIWWYSVAVLFSLPFCFSFFLNQRDIRWNSFANPMSIPLFVYGISILPSFWNAVEPIKNIVLLFNVVAFLIVFYSLVVALRTYEDLRRVVAVYLGMTILNGLNVILESIVGGRRAFGFAGIMYVDYAGLGICVSAAMAIVSRVKMQFVLIFVSILLAAALVLTQTRSIWLATLLTLMVLGAYAFLRPSVAGESRTHLAVIMIGGLMVMVGVGAFLFSSNPEIEKRSLELGQDKSLGVSERGEIGSSLTSRLLIWDTALNAFVAHPLVGIGVYGFPLESAQYSRIPAFLYRRFVAGLSPHQTFFAVLAETGIVGFFGFTVFLFVLLRSAFQAIHQASDERGRKYAFVGAIAVTYCTVSMLFTDAWLWGRGIILLAMVMGLVMANRKIAARSITH